MTIHVTWFNQEHRILLLTFPSVWEWEALSVAYREALELTSNMQQSADVILDMRQVRRLPAHALNHAIRMAGRWGKHFGRAVFVTDQETLLPFGQAAYNIIPYARKQAHHTVTIAQAATLLEGERTQAIQSR